MKLYQATNPETGECDGEIRCEKHLPEQDLDDGIVWIRVATSYNIACETPQCRPVWSSNKALIDPSR
ncbi:MAG: hypothetical protein OES13_00330 [Acidimicrobiia bacterium]|nr:hypothetical protein [Acidimicrobiia bacterium]